MKPLIAALVFSLSLFAQDGTPVNQSAGPPTMGYSSLYYYSGTNLIYVCTARSLQARTVQIAVSAASNANPVSFTATAHHIGDYTNLGATMTPTIKITGGTGNWVAVNGVWTATPTSANAFTIPVDSTSLGALTGTLVVTTVAPLLTSPVWAIQAFTYLSGTSQISFTGWAGATSGVGAGNLTGGSSGASFACSSRATLSYQ